jgi:hypothetical protein
MIALVALWTVVVPGGIAAAFVLLSRLVRAESPVRGALAALGLCGGAAAAHVGHAGFPAIPPIDTLGWIPLVSAGSAVALAALERCPPRLGALAAALAVAMGALGAYLVGRPAFGGASAAPVASVAVLGVGAGLAIALDDRAGRRLPGWARLAWLMIAAIAASVASLFAATALFALLFAGVAASVGGLLVAGLVLRRLVATRATFGVAVILLGLQLLYVTLYGELDAWSAGLLGGAIVAPLLAGTLPISPRTRGVVAICLGGALGGGAVLAGPLPGPGLFG